MTHASDAGEWLLFLGKEVLESKGGWPTAARSSRLLSILRRRICVAAEWKTTKAVSERLS